MRSDEAPAEVTDDVLLRVRQAVRSASQGLVEREALCELVLLAAVAREHLLVVGPPGTAKSEASRRISRALGGRYFEYLLGKFTEPSELFGPVDLRKLREGQVVTDTTGMLPEAEIAFLDEVFLASTAILNTLLGILNERTFRRGHTDLRCPLRVCVGASNALPDDPALGAFADRFLLRVFVDSLPDTRLEELLEGGWSPAPSGPPEATVADLDALAERSRAVDLTGVRPLLADAIRALRKRGIELSDRRVVKVQKLVAAAAALGGRTVATAADLWPLVSALPTAAAQAEGREVLQERLRYTDNQALPAAAVAVSRGPSARARLLEESGAALLAGADGTEAWRLRVEGTLRDVDATFAKDQLPPALAGLRSQLIEALAGPS
jgi:MoxR-like ATPase